MSTFALSIFSNCLEILYEQLEKTLFYEGSSLFTRRLIVVPSPAIQTYLKRMLAESPRCQIASAVDIILPGHAIKKLVTIQGKQPSALALAMALESEIRRIFPQFPLMDKENQARWLPLLRFLGIPNTKTSETLTTRGEHRLTQICEQLAFLFNQYGEYGGQIIDEWKSNPQNLAWQESLYLRVFNASGSWIDQTSAVNHLIHKDAALIGEKPLEIHLFALSFISSLHDRFFRYCASKVPCFLYHLSPCMGFWSDIRSMKEVRSIGRYSKSEEHREKIKASFNEGNRLLANFGKLGRQAANLYDEMDDDRINAYRLSSSLLEKKEFSEFLDTNVLLSEDKEPLSLLKAVQADMLLLREPNEPIHLEAGDQSFQVHAVGSKLREIQVAYDTILRIIDKHRHDEDPISPSDCIVMAPEIMDYASLIQMVFSHPDSVFDIQILDLRLPAQSRLMSAFEQLLSLSEGRWDVSSVLELFDSAAFRKRHKLSQSDIVQIQQWVKDLGIRWGCDPFHRDELLEKAHCESGMLDRASTGTWEQGISRLLLGLAMLEENTDPNSELPFEGISALQGELLGKWIQLLRGLRKSLSPLHDGTQLCLKEWSSLLSGLFEDFLAVDESNHRELADQRRLYQHLKAFSLAAEEQDDRNKEQTYSFVSIKRHLKSLMRKDSLSYHENALQAIRFCSMLPMRAVPFKVIYLLGMEEGQYPRRELKQSMNLLYGNPLSDYCPTRSDFDRYLFLEAILSARNTFCVSYQSYAYEDASEKHPSLLLTEVLNYIDKGYRIGDTLPSESCIQKHPFHPFASCYFDGKESEKWQSYAPSLHKQALAFCGKVRHTPSRVFHPPQCLEPTETTLSLVLSNLRQIARHPIRTFLFQSLGVRAPQLDSWNLVSDEVFTLSGWNVSQLRSAMLFSPFEEVSFEAERRALLPLGRFADVAKKRLALDGLEQKRKLEFLGLDIKNLYSLQLSRTCLEKEEIKENSFKLAAIELELSSGQKVFLEGELVNLSTEGYLVESGDSLPDVLRAWPEYLAFCLLIEESHLEGKKDFLSLKKGSRRTDLGSPARKLLTEWVEYSLTALETASPLMPDWSSAILNRDAKTVKKLILASAQSQWTFDDPALAWVFRSEDELEVDSILDAWSEKAEALYKPLLEAWFPRQLACVDKV
jgi:exodeoxyribonuclease V gamma subunit